MFIDQGGASLLRIGERGELGACTAVSNLYVYLQLTALCHELIRQPPGRSVLPGTSNRYKSSCGEGRLKTNPQERTHAQLRLQLVPLAHSTGSRPPGIAEIKPYLDAQVRSISVDSNNVKIITNDQTSQM